MKKGGKKMRYTMGAVLSAIFLLFAVPAHPHVKERVSIEIISDGGGTFLTIPYKDSGRGATRVIKKYLEAVKGKNYSIAVRNNTAQRLGVVIAVDGRNIITGERSNLRSHEMMYIINPYSRTTLKGWRTDGETVHRFHFTDAGDSYSVRTFADSSAMGVIAVAVYGEKQEALLQKRSDREAGKRRSAGAPAPSAGRELRVGESDSAGTGFGEGHYSPTVKVEFTPQKKPFEKVLVKYEWRSVLCTKGLLKCRKEERNRLWDDEYAPYPPGYHD